VPSSDQPADRHAWLQPTPEQVSPGVFRLPLPLPMDGLRAVNVYAIQNTDGLALIDGGWALVEGRTALVAGLKEIGAGLGDIRAFFVTHVHRDHYTQAVAVRREVGSTVALGEGEKPSLAIIHQNAKANAARPAAFTVLRERGAGALIEQLGKPPEVLTSMDDWEDPDRWLTDQEQIELTSRNLRVTATPGHTRGHVVYRDEAAALLFAGDHVLPHITPSIGFEPAQAKWPLQDYLASLKLVRSQPDAMLLPAHGPATASTHQRIDELLSHHAQRLDESLAALVSGAETVYEVSRTLKWTRRETALDDLDIGNQMFAVAETAAHLDVLVLDGRARMDTDDEGIHHYYAS
jgi:glyoxylase-like metal-dependent hydrolase (beta-lactamase superfamily II)